MHERILIVDDESAIVAFIKKLLEKEDYRVQGALNFQEAVAAIRQNPPDLILLDIHLSEANGLEFFSWMKNNEKWKTKPVIFMTGSADSDTIERAYQIGGADCLAKPFTRTDLLTCIKTHLNSSREV